MHSKIDRIEGQLNAKVRRAHELLGWIVDEFGREEFSLNQILDTIPLSDPVKSEELDACERLIKERHRVFSLLEEKGYVEESGRDHLVTEKGRTRMHFASTKRLSTLFQVAKYSKDRVRWASLGGKPFEEGRGDDQLMDDLLLKIFSSWSGGPVTRFNKDRYVGRDEMKDLKDRQHDRRRQINERSRVSAAFNWLKEKDLIESVEDDDIFSLTLKGDQYLASAA